MVAGVEFTQKRPRTLRRDLWSKVHSVSFCRRISRRAVGALLAAGCGSSLLSGCLLDADDCAEGEARCDGNVAQVCAATEHGGRRGHHWSARDCGDGACVTVGNANANSEAFCALSAQPDARCSEPEGASCDGSALVACHAAYATAVTPCAQGCVSLEDLTDYCRENPPEAVHCVSGDGCELASPHFSAMSGNAPGPVCSASQFGPVADAATRVYSYRCEAGLLTSRRRCTAACIATTSCTTHCDDAPE